MFFFNLIGVAFSACGLVVAGGLWWLFRDWFGDTVASFAGAMFLGSLFTAALDLRYRWLNEEIPPAPTRDGKPRTEPESSLVSDLAVGSLSFSQRCFNLVWPFAGGHLLWMPVYVPGVLLFTGYFLGFFGWIFHRS
jgi:hypothetical protein